MYVNEKNIFVSIGCCALLLLLTLSSNATNVNYTYDVMGRLTQADYGNGTVVTYTYDLMGNRTSQTAPPLPAGLPIVTTETPTVTTLGIPPTVYATLEGTVNANRASTTVTFEYGLTTAYGSSVTATPGIVTGLKATKVKNETITGLQPNTTYHYRVKAVNSAGTSYGNDIAFTTPSGVVSAVTASPAGGLYSGPVTVTLTGVDALMILYSTDGSEPSQFYTAPITIAATTTLKFFAYTNSGMSQVVTETYTIGSTVLPLMIDGTIPRYFSLMQDACDAAGNGSLIKAQAALFTENLLLNTANRTVSIKGGYEPTFTTQTGVTTVNGRLTIKNGRLVVYRVVVR